MKKIILMLVIYLSYGCSIVFGWDSLAKTWIGSEVSDFNKRWRSPDEILMEDNKKVYKYHLKKSSPSCIHYWVVNESEIIVDYRYEGYCHPI